MKNYFPFTDYDFYAYLTSGALFLCVVDLAFNNAQLMARTEWTFVQAVVAIASAYVAGHILATLAQLVIETFALSKIVSKPIVLQLGYKKPNLVERVIGTLVGRYYEPLEETVQQRIKNSAHSALSKPEDQKVAAEEVFQAGFRNSFSVDGARPRIDSFLNQYGFCRNISFVGLLATGIVGWQAYNDDLPYEGLVLSVSALVFLGMFVRFVKFYASFQAEVIRTLLK